MGELVFIEDQMCIRDRAWSDHRRLGLPFFENQAVEKDYNPLNQVPLTVATSKECRWDFYPKRYRYPANIQTNNQAGYAQALQPVSYTHLIRFVCKERVVAVSSPVTSCIC